MTRRHAPKGMTATQLIDALVDDLQRIRDEIRWKEEMAYGPRGAGDAPHVSGSGRSDPTATQQSDGLSAHLRRVLHTTHKTLTWLYQRKVPEILARLELDDETGGHQGAGVSAYRGDRRAPAGRPDVQQALDAQHRRNRRGESHGAG